MVPNSQSQRRRSLRSPSAANPVIGRTSPPTPRLAETPLPAAERLSENVPLPPTRSREGAHFHPWLAEASAPPPPLRIARGQNPTHAVVATAAKIGCPVASTVESGELRLWPLHKSSFPSARCNLHRRGRRVTRLEFLALRKWRLAPAKAESYGRTPARSAAAVYWRHCAVRSGWGANTAAGPSPELAHRRYSRASKFHSVSPGCPHAPSYLPSDRRKG